MEKKTFDNKIIVVLLHLLGWFCFLLYPFILGVPLREEIFLRILMHTALLSVFFYLNINLLIPQLLTKGRFAIYFISVLLIICLIVGVNIFFYHFLEIDPKTFSDPEMLKRFQGGQHQLRRYTRPLFSALFIFAISTSYRLLYDWFKNERKKKEIENENLSSELSFLKSQVSPHFLFNTLNNIYSLSLNNSSVTSDAILKLSQLLRYMLYESDVKQVSLDKELDYLHNYIELQKMRIREDVDITFNKKGDFENMLIEPMLLIPFIENAFKHGVSYSEKSIVRIDVSIEGKKLELVVENNIHASLGQTNSNSGIGLNNVRRRLSLLYPEMHHLKTIQEGNKYIVNLQLVLKK